MLIIFCLEDITPPRITFMSAPSKTNSSASISWIFNENSTVRCSLNTPISFIRNINCSTNSWSGDSLIDGYYTIWVCVTDEAGNTALPGQHSWRVG